MNEKLSHLGITIFAGLNKNKDYVCQIDAATGEKETCGSVLKRSVELAKCLLRTGMQVNDVIWLSGRNHLDLRIPFYAGMMIGCPVAGIDPLFKFEEIKNKLDIIRPKIAFCQKNRFEEMTAAAKDLGLDTKIVTFEDGEHGFKTFLETFTDANDETEFRPRDIDPKTTYVWLVSTSGSTGVPKVAAFTHYAIAVKFILKYFYKPTQESTLKGMWLNLSSVSWMSFYMTSVVAAISGCGVLSTSADPTPENCIDIINAYKPTNAVLMPMFVSEILRHPKPCDWSCFSMLHLSGSKVYPELLQELKKRTGPESTVEEIYGQSEILLQVFTPSPVNPAGSCGRKNPLTTDLKIVDVETLDEITAPNKQGELWVKEVLFDCYYNMPEQTKLAFSDDGWYKSGDLFYRDENDYYYFVDRHKLLLKYRGVHILPSEIEAVVLRMPGVLNVAVTGIPDSDLGDRPVGLVVCEPGHRVTADDVKHFVAQHLSVGKNLYGGVIFTDRLPLTATGKIDRAKLKEIALKAAKQ